MNPRKPRTRRTKVDKFLREPRRTNLDKFLDKFAEHFAREALKLLAAGWRPDPPPQATSRPTSPASGPRPDSSARPGAPCSSCGRGRLQVVDPSLVSLKCSECGAREPYESKLCGDGPLGEFLRELGKLDPKKAN